MQIDLNLPSGQGHERSTSGVRRSRSRSQEAEVIFGSLTKRTFSIPWMEETEACNEWRKCCPCKGRFERMNIHQLHPPVAAPATRPLHTYLCPINVLSCLQCVLPTHTMEVRENRSKGTVQRLSNPTYKWFRHAPHRTPSHDVLIKHARRSQLRPRVETATAINQLQRSSSHTASYTVEMGFRLKKNSTRFGIVFVCKDWWLILIA